MRIKSNKTDEFISCMKWRIFIVDDYIVLHNRTIVFKPNNKTYSAAEYWIEDDVSALVCIPNDCHPSLYFLDYVGVSVRGLSLLALLFSIVVDLWVVREIRGNSVRPIICHKLSLICFYASMCLNNAKSCGQVGLETDVVASLCLYSSRVAYCWINVISFDMWQTFRPTGIIRRPSLVLVVASISIRRFTFQFLYAVGFPAVLCITAYCLGMLPIPILDAWRHSGPMYGNLLQVIFMSSTISLIVIVNAFFCFLIIRNLRYIKQRSNRKILNIEDNNELFHVYLKLVVVSGFLYFLQLGQYFAAHYGMFNPFWLIPDWLANSQGVWLLIIYSCNGSVRRATYNKMKCLSRRKKANFKINVFLLSWQKAQSDQNNISQMS